MNKRLACILSHISDGIGMIDVGTDHALIPIALATQDYSGGIFASDVRPGPLESARKNAALASVSERITFLLADGLEACDPEKVDTIVIAGMGGDTICGILDRAEWCIQPKYTLVLQPMTHGEVLRYWLVHNGFMITEEEIVEDNGILYPVFIAAYGESERLSEAEMFTGSERLLHNHPLYPVMLSKQLKRLHRIVSGRQSAVSEDLSAYASIIEEIIRQLEEMAEHAKTH